MADPTSSPIIPTARPNMEMLASERLINFIKDKEKFFAKPYKDYKQWSIGYGSYAGSLDSNPTVQTITEAAADQLLREQIKKYEANVSKFNYFYNFTQNEFDALVSFAYNIGSINQLTANGSRSKEEILQKIPQYNKAGGKVLKGLQTRRDEEVSIFKGENFPSSYNENNITPSSLRTSDEDPIGDILTREGAVPSGIQSFQQTSTPRRRSGGGGGGGGFQRQSSRTNNSLGFGPSILNLGVQTALDVAPERVTGEIQRQIESFSDLPLPSGQLANEIVQSLQTGSGIASFVNPLNQIAGAPAGAERLYTLGQVGLQYPDLTKALVVNSLGLDPSLDKDRLIIERINNFDIARIVNIEGQSPAQRALTVIEAMLASGELDFYQTRGVGFIEAGLNNILSEGLDPETEYEKTSNLLINLAREQLEEFTIGDDLIRPETITRTTGRGRTVEIEQDLTYEERQANLKRLQDELRTYLTGSLGEIMEESEIQKLLSPLQGILQADEASLRAGLVTEVSSMISSQTGFEPGAVETILAGAESEQDLNKARASVGGKVLDDYITSNPTLKSIIDFFDSNKELMILLGSTAGLSALSGLMGGGMFGGALAGAGGVAATRFIFGEEGFSDLMSTLNSAATPAFDFIQNLFDESGISDIPILGDMLGGVMGLGRENPVAALSALTGNFGGAAGILAGTAGVNLFDGKTSFNAMLESLSDNVPAGANKIVNDIAIALGRPPSSDHTEVMGNNTAGSNPNGSPGMTGLYNPDMRIFTKDNPGGIGTAAMGNY